VLPGDEPTQGTARPALPAHPALPARPGLVNAANALTVLRLALVPVFVACLLAGGTGWRVAAFVVFAVASVTDLLDGRIARSRGLVTDFGKIADPIADKALTGAALVTLSALGELPWWVTVLILAREIAVTVLRFWVIRHGVIAASRGGKLKTLLQVVAIALYVLPGPPATVRAVVMAAAVAVTLVTGADYGVRAVRLHRRPPRGPAGTGEVGAGGAGTGGAGTGDAGAGGAGAVA
jgi:CDP-diacylglycerol--glycerol-3-phosphate 3-phosphatidyltransferase